MSLIDRVDISQGSLISMVRSVIHTGRREEAGNLYGLRRRNRLVITGVAPCVLAKQRGLTIFDPNAAAEKRTNRVDIAFGRDGSIEGSFVGGYHSHITETTCYKRSRYNHNTLSTRDLVVSEEELERGISDLDQWIEIVLRMEKKEYRIRQEVGTRTIEYPRRLKIIVRTPQPNKLEDDFTNIGYHVTLMGFRVTHRDGYSDLADRFPKEDQVNKRLSFQEIEVRRRRSKMTSARTK